MRKRKEGRNEHDFNDKTLGLGIRSGNMEYDGGINMKTSKLKLTFIVLLTATVVWAIAFHYTLQEYHRCVEQLGPWDLAEPYWAWNGGRYVTFTGGLLLFAWIGFATLFFSQTLSKRRKAVSSCAVLLLISMPVFF
jgi:hypothetical protein